MNYKTRSVAMTETIPQNQESESSEFGWMPDRWFCGTSNQRCRHCGRPVVFAPDCIEADACACDRAHAQGVYPIRTAAGFPLPQDTANEQER